MHPPLQRMHIRSQTINEFDALHNIFGDNIRTDKHGNPRSHAGWDLEASIGTSIFAIAPGEISRLWDSDTYGKVITLGFEYNGLIVYAFYAHLSARFVSTGQKVKEGEWIGLTGDSGNAEGEHPHLHFEIRYVPFLPSGLGNQGRIDPALIFGQYLVCI